MTLCVCVCVFVFGCRDCPEASAKVSSTVCSARGPWEGPRRATVLPRLQSLEFFFFFSHLFARSGCFPIPVHGDTRKCVPNGTVAVQRRIDHGLAFSSAIERTPPPSGSRQPLAAPHGWNPPPPAAGPLPRRHAPPAQGASTTTSAPPARQHQREHLTTNLDSEALGTRHNRATAPTGSPAPSAQATAAPRLAPPIAHAPPRAGPQARSHSLQQSSTPRASLRHYPTLTKSGSRSPSINGPIPELQRTAANLLLLPSLPPNRFHHLLHHHHRSHTHPPCYIAASHPRTSSWTCHLPRLPRRLAPCRRHFAHAPSPAWLQGCSVHLGFLLPASPPPDSSG